MLAIRLHVRLTGPIQGFRGEPPVPIQPAATLAPTGLPVAAGEDADNAASKTASTDPDADASLVPGIHSPLGLIN